MKDLVATALKYQGHRLWVLDQHRLPFAEDWLLCDSVPAMVGMIQQLQIRGAPLIGIGAALLLAHLAEEGASDRALREAAATLRAARPTAVNLMHCMDRILAVLDEGGERADLVACAEQLFAEDVALCDRLAEAGAQWIADGDQLLTHCNTGSLATAGVGTALGAIRRAHQQGKRIHVWVDETRPLLQGGRLTTWELQRLEIPHTLICDSMAAPLLRDGRVNRVLVGADRIARNGDTANKVGTYGLAVQAFFHQVPFAVVAPYTTLDRHCADGDAIPIEQRAASEITGVSGSFGACQWAPPATPVDHPAFDVTPARLISAWILDSGTYRDGEGLADAFHAIS